MQSNFDNVNISESFKSIPTAGLDGLQSFRMPESAATYSFDTAKNLSTMLAFDGANGFALFDSAKESDKGGGESLTPRGNKDEKLADGKGDDEHERGKDDENWVKGLLGANENNAEYKDLKESLGRIKPNDLAPVLDALKNLKHDEAMQILKDNFDKFAGADKGINLKELANALENEKNPKVRAACIYATRYFGDFAKAANMLGPDWSGPVIDRADLDAAKKPEQ